MPEAAILYTLTSGVIVGLLAFVVFSLSRARQAWVREPQPSGTLPGADAPPVSAAISEPPVPPAPPNG